ncbi:hypothetical protein BDN70DRAFT_566420 [Pholiota conissans]|uniref:Uncharacterized protein n=1 Tax=Pholiota conissans TaxID=109636 RepID=A0A9P6D2Y2_9AGAR|nr:hypothetical protein BDN70DRAFT_566420 [Pholiota conissans]
MNQPGVGLMYLSGISDNISQIACLSQTHDGIPIGNTTAKIIFTPANKIRLYTCSFTNPIHFSSSIPSLSPQSAIALGETALDATFVPRSNIKGAEINIEYLVKEHQTAVLVYGFDLENEHKGTSWRAFVNAHTGEIEDVINHVYRTKLF